MLDAVPAERDLATLLATLDVVRRPGTFVFLQVPPGAEPPPGTAAMVDEGDSVTYVVDEATLGAPGSRFRAAWLTLTVHSALDSVGLTAAVASALAQRGIPGNVLAGHDHDHLLVPVERADEAIAVLRRLAAGAGTAQRTSE
jgi:uncharacterized protein